MTDPRYIDLHTHSTASDGSFSPTELVAEAARAGLAAIALTDHDTTLGLQEALRAGQEHGVEVIPGCELSVKTEHGSRHILGLWLSEKPGPLMQAMDELREYRHDRNHIIVDMLNKAGVDVTYDEIKAIAGEGSVGRPHIARAIMDKGAVQTVQQAFDEYLAPGGKAYAPKKVMTPEKAIGLLKAEGATVILAHPDIYGRDLREMRDEIAALKEMGLEGIEAYYSSHSPDVLKAYLDLAHRMGLVISGGSDFHGTPKPTLDLGTGYGTLHIPYGVLADLKAHRMAHGQPV